jgi:hypothetical protein
MQDRLLTDRFKEIYGLSGLWPVWARHLLLGLLVWLEAWWIDQSVQQNVTEAIEEWHRQEDLVNPTQFWTDVEIEEKPSEVPGLPELRIRAPWVERE